MGLNVSLWFKIYGCIFAIGVIILIIGIIRRQGRHSWIKGNYGIDSPYSIRDYSLYTLLIVISPFVIIYCLEFMWDPLHWLACSMLLILSWSIAFMPGFIAINIVYSSLVTKYEILNRLLHTISQMKLDCKVNPITKGTSKTRRGDHKRIQRSNFVKSEFKWLESPFKAWEGTEQVLDIGCGRGLLTNWIAGKYIRDNLDKILKKKNNIGGVTGIDIWDNVSQYGNNMSRTVLNSEKENVSQFVQIMSGDAKRLPFESGTFDVVVSSLTIHNIMERDSSDYAKEERSKAIQEAIRVLKKGGIIAFYDIFISEEYVQELIRSKDIVSIDQSEELPGFYQGHIITAYKKP